MNPLLNYYGVYICWVTAFASRDIQVYRPLEHWHKCYTFFLCSVTKWFIIFPVTVSAYICMRTVRSYRATVSDVTYVSDLSSSKQAETALPADTTALSIHLCSACCHQASLLLSTEVAVRLPARLLRRLFFVFARNYSTQCVGKTLLQCLLGNSSRQISNIDQTSNQRSWKKYTVSFNAISSLVVGNVAAVVENTAVRVGLFASFWVLIFCHIASTISRSWTSYSGNVYTLCMINSHHLTTMIPIKLRQAHFLAFFCSLKFTHHKMLQLNASLNSAAQFNAWQWLLVTD